MKETEAIQKDQVVNVRQVQAKKHREHLGSMMISDGHKLYVFNKKTYELDEAKFKQANAKFDTIGTNRNVSSVKDVEVKEDCYYFSALNLKNAVKKITKKFKNIPYIDVIVND